MRQKRNEGADVRVPRIIHSAFPVGFWNAIQSSHQMNRISAVAAALVCFFAVSSSVPVAALPSPRGRAVLGASNRASTSVATTAEISSCPRLRSHRPTWRRPKCVPGHFWNCYRRLTALAGDLLLLIIVHRRKATHGTITTLVSTFIQTVIRSLTLSDWFDRNEKNEIACAELVSVLSDQGGLTVDELHAKCVDTASERFGKPTIPSHG
jgi:hypothetical protein